MARRALSAGFAVLGAGLLWYGGWAGGEAPQSMDQPLPPSAAALLEPPSAAACPSVSLSEAATEPKESLLPKEKMTVYPTDRLFITTEREAYEDGQMTLRIPRLSLELPVLDGTEASTLKRGAGLYEYSPLPGRGNANISIAAHRDIYGSEFYELDRLTEDDLLFLSYEGVDYTYRYRDTQIVEKNDWSPIHCKSFAALTLTSCDPIGTSLRRIVVTAELLKTEPKP